MKGRNVCQFIGNLGSAPEVKYTNTGTPRCKFSLAINKRYTTNGETHEKTTWADCIAWGSLAELCGKYLIKGAPVFIEAEFELNEYEVEGTKRKKAQFVVQDLTFLGQKEERRPVAAVAAAAAGSPITDDDIPF